MYQYFGFGLVEFCFGIIFSFFGLVWFFRFGLQVKDNSLQNNFGGSWPYGTIEIKRKT